MKNNRLIKIILVIFIIGAILFFYYHNKRKDSTILDVTKQELIQDDLYIDVIYKYGNMIDEEIQYGNELIKELELTNNNDIDLNYSLVFEETSISNEKLVYSLYAKDEESDSFKELVKEINILDDTSIGFNLIISAKSKIYLKIVFKALMENENTILKGIIRVNSNLTSKDVFIKNVEEIHANVNETIDNLNGIGTPGIYILDVTNLNISNNNLRGYLLIDARDISIYKYIYTLYNDKYMINNYLYEKQIEKNKIIEKDNNVINNLSINNICISYSKDKCSDFNSLEYNHNESKKEFLNNVNRVVNSLNKDNSNTPDIYQINEDNLRGYILVDNTKETKDIYIYLTNNIYMISGYNLTKYGNISENSGTIRSYTDSAFNLSSSSPDSVCSFTGLSNCVIK